MSARPLLVPEEGGTYLEMPHAHAPQVLWAKDPKAEKVALKMRESAREALIYECVSWEKLRLGDVLQTSSFCYINHEPYCTQSYGSLGYFLSSMT